MSRLPNPAPTVSKKPGAVLALHKVATAYRYVIASSGAGGNGAAALRVTDSGTIPAGDVKALDSLRQKAGSNAAFVQVIPPEATILRSAPPKLVLDGTPEQVASALSLVAEAELPTTIPAHRRCAGVLRAGHAHAVYAVGWIGPENTVAPGAVTVPAVAALSALFRITGATSGLLVYTDAPTGVVALIGAGKGESPRLFVRVLRDDASDPQAFSAVRDEAVEDIQYELDADAPTPFGPALRLPDHPPAGLGISGEEKFSEFALALGAAAFALEAKPDEQPLLAMTDRSPTAGRTIFTRIADGLATPKAAAVAAAVCCCVLLTGWILAAPIKLAILQSRVGNDTGDYNKAIQQHDWYKALHDRRWPMTALIAELTSGAPEGIRIETLTIEQGRPVNLTGTADTPEAVYAWCKSLRGKVFGEATPSIPAEDVSPIRFTIKADVTDALAAVVSELKPVIVTNDTPRPHTDTPSRTERNTRTTNGSGTTRTTNNNGRNNGRANSATPSTGAASSAAAEPPPPMSDAQIERLASGPATIEWAKRKGQLSRTDLDAATQSRLQHELTMIEARRKALGGGQ